MTLKKIRKSEKGQSLVEFALVLPVFLLILFGIIEFGRIWMTVNVITGAAREGARVAAVTAPDASRVRSTVQSVLTATNVGGATISVSGPSSGNQVSVTVSVNYTTITGSLIPGLGSNVQLSRTATMRWEG